jgi:L-fuculose-phosphate aldolase
VSWKEERDARDEIVDVHRRLYELGFSVANDGNTSMKVDAKRILITPSGLDKARLQREQMAMIDVDGHPLSGNYEPSSEIAVHTMIYKRRPDVSAIIHAHPPFAIACSLAGVSLDQYTLPEVVISLGKIPTVPYATTGTAEVGESVSEAIEHHDAVIMDRHGTVTVGKTLSEALSKLERVEHTAKIISIANTLGKISPLPQDEVRRLLKIGIAMGLQKGSPRDVESMIEKSAQNAGLSGDQDLVHLITREVQAILSEKK